MEKNKMTVLIPSMLDFHFPLLQYAFNSKHYTAVVLDNENDITKIGLRYTHNDLCYPAILIIGQMISALQSGDYDLNKTILLIPQAGDACRGSNYIHMIRKALKKAGFANVPIISLNFKGLESDNKFSITLGMVRRAVAAIMYGDLLMILKNQIEPYEVIKGQTTKYIDKWITYLGAEIKSGKNLSVFCIKKMFRSISNDFKNVGQQEKNIKKVGIVGELYVKYCHLGNWNLEKFLRDESCEYMVNGFSWYILYYIDTHLTEEKVILGSLYKIALKFLKNLQKAMIDSIFSAGFHCIDEFSVFKHNAEGKVSYKYTVADGWLIGCEIVNLVLMGYNKVLCVQPFGCMPNHVCGKGIYPSIQRELQNAQVVSIDYDSSGSEINVRNRIRMLLDI